ncbi:MAG: hypothetical protein QXR74_06080 [Candidatus Bathyarchaeia archaeon]
MQADVEEELFREKSKALSEIFEDLYDDWVVFFEWLRRENSVRNSLVKNIFQ